MKSLFSSLILLLLSFNQVFAQNTGGGTNNENTGGGSNPLTIPNPLDPTNQGNVTIATLLSRVTDFLVLIAVPLLTLAILYAAFQMITARGNEEQFKLGKKVLLYAVIGFAILLVSEGLIKLIESILVGNNPTP